MTYRIAYNATDSALVVDPSGRILGGREHGAVDDLFDEVDLAVERGDLVYVTEEGNIAQESTVAEEVDALNDRRKGLLDGATPGDLRRAAARRGLPSDEQTPTALSSMLARTDAELDEVTADDDTDTEA